MEKPLRGTLIHKVPTRHFLHGERVESIFEEDLRLEVGYTNRDRTLTIGDLVSITKSPKTLWERIKDLAQPLELEEGEEIRTFGMLSIEQHHTIIANRLGIAVEDLDPHTYMVEYSKMISMVDVISPPKKQKKADATEQQIADVEEIEKESEVTTIPTPTLDDKKEIEN